MSEAAGFLLLIGNDHSDHTSGGRPALLIERENTMGDQNREIKRGDIFYAGLDPIMGSEQGGVRPVLVLQNNIGNRHSPTVIVAAITSRAGKPRLPTHVPIGGALSGLYKESVVLLEQVRTIDRARLREYIGALEFLEMQAVDGALEISVGLAEGFK